MRYRVVLDKFGDDKIKVRFRINVTWDSIAVFLFMEDGKGWWCVNFVE